MQTNNTENQNDMDFLKAQNKITIIDIPEQVRKADKAEEAKKAERERINKHIIFYQFTKRRVYTTALKAYLMYLACNICYALIFNRKSENSTNQEEIEDQFKKPLSDSVLAYYIIVICILGPLIEEFIFRSFIFKLINWVGKKVQKKVKVIGIIIRILAFLISSFLFAFSHFSFSFEILTKEIRTFPSYFLMGLFFAYAYNRDGYILASVFTHMLNNVIATLCIYCINYTAIDDEILSFIREINF